MEKQLVLFDYGQLDHETRNVVEQRTGEIKSLMRRTAQDIIEIGQKLIEVKERLPHGDFGGWLTSEFGWSDSTAIRFMRVAKHFKSVTVTDLNIPAKALYLLAAPSTPEAARQDIMARAQSGETITYSTAKNDINDYKNGHATPNPVVDSDKHLESAPGEAETTGLQSVVADSEELVRTNGQVRMSQPMQMFMSSGDNEWYTPVQYLDLARQLLGKIDLDPASSQIAQQTVQARWFFTAEDDGLNQKWFGKVWLNPPFDKSVVWTEKLIQAYETQTIDEALLLVKIAFGYNWFTHLRKNYPVCLLDERIAFLRPDGTTPGPHKIGSAIFYFGPQIDRFEEIFAPLGRIENVSPKNYKRDNKANYTPTPAKDNCQTPGYAVYPLLRHLKQFEVIWEPAAGEGYLVSALRQAGLTVFGSDIQTGQDFFTTTPDQDWGCQVTNPPFSRKYEWLARCYDVGKPFALLMPVEVLGAQTAQRLFDAHGIEIIFLDKRVDFKMPNLGWDGGGAQFPVGWFTWGLNIGQQMTFASISKE